MPVSVSFRDPSGSVLCTDDRVIRRVAEEQIPEFTRFIDSRAARSFVETRKLVSTKLLAETEGTEDLWHLGTAVSESFAATGKLYEHERIWFPSYAYEWPPEMLYEAGLLTLDLAEASLAEGYGLKDATPFNILFDGPRPVFVDVLSFEQRTPGDQVWLPYTQLVRMFLLPLLMYKHFGANTHECLASHPNGLEPEEAYVRCSVLQRLYPQFIGSVSIPTWLGRSARANRSVRTADQIKIVDPERAEFIVRSQLKRLRKSLLAVDPGSKHRNSIWTEYVSTMSYSGDEFDLKREYVRKWLDIAEPKTVLDVGCNTGVYSEIAAKAGAAVVSLDYDPLVVGQVWKRAHEQQLNIQPLVVNLARPTPATGWCNAENSSFLERAKGRFNTVMMLAVLHHLLVTERIPLTDIFKLAASLTTDYLILEYVDREDEMFQQLLRGRDALHTGFTKGSFENTCQNYFTIIDKTPVKGRLRSLYLLRKR